MKKYNLIFISILLFILAIAGCSGLPGSDVAEDAVTTDAETTLQPGQNPGAMGGRLEDKLAYGILKLEGTDQAVTAEQAKNLLPLWKAMKSLGASDTASSEEIAALYAQIQETMTEGQLQTIQDLRLTPEDLQALMTQYNIEAPDISQQAGNEDQRATRSAQFQAQGGGQGGFPGGGEMGGAMPGGGMAGAMPPGGTDGGQLLVQGTPGTRPDGAGGRAMLGMNTLWWDALITFLSERAG